MNDNTGQLQYPANNESAASIWAAIYPFVNSNSMDVDWNNFFHYFTSFDHVITYPATTGMGVAVDTNGTASSTVSNSSTTLSLITGTAHGGFARVSKSPAYNSFLTFNAPSYFRSAFSVDSGTSVIAYLVRGNSDTTSYGFKLNDGTLQGVVNDGTSETTVNLATPNFTTVVPSAIYGITAKFYPLSKCVFFVNGLEAGIITTGLPTGIPGVADSNLYDIKATNTSSVQKTFSLSFIEIIQRKLNPSQQ